MVASLHFDDIVLAHDPGAHHPEHRARLSQALRELERRPSSELARRPVEPADDEALRRVHAPEHLEAMRSIAGRRGALDPDTAYGPDTHAAALTAAGAALGATREAANGATGGALALVRPPGHHAEANRAMGFCFFNNVAIAAAAAVDELGLERVLVVDPDVHHGNGTQHVFEDRADVLYVSSHQYPFYPGTGAATEIGRGVGTGFTINLPLPAGAGDAELLHGWRTVVSPVVAAWRPEIVIVSAGFDTWHRDPIGGLAVTEAGFRALFELFTAWTAAHCPGRLIACLEGGYDPEGVAVGVAACLDAMGSAPRPGETPALGDPSPAAVGAAGAARRALAPHWHALRD